MQTFFIETLGLPRRVEIESDRSWPQFFYDALMIKPKANMIIKIKSTVVINNATIYVLKT